MRVCCPRGIVKRKVRIRSGGLAVAAALLASAAAIPSDAAAGVEYGRCLEVTTGAGAFQDAGCTARAQPGKFEWYPGFEGAKRIVRTGFSITHEERGGAARLGLLKSGRHEEKYPNPIQCSEAFGTGHLSGPHSWAAVKLSVTRFCKKSSNPGNTYFRTNATPAITRKQKEKPDTNRQNKKK
jgi:hypothetical protein